MRIVHVSTYDIQGGAARAAYRLHRGLLEAGEDSRMIVRKRTSNDNTVRAFVPEGSRVARWRRRIRRRQLVTRFSRYRTTRPEGLDLFSQDRSIYGSEIGRQIPACEIVNLHWVAGFADYGTLFPHLAKRGLPVVWTLHDMNPFTGGCHYDGGCGRFSARCGMCPQLGSRADADLSREVWERKQAALRKTPGLRLHVVADSEWLASEARRSSLLRDVPVETIHYGLDTGMFAPRGRDGSRSVLGLPGDRPIVFFAADSVTNARKGLAILVRALAEVGGRLPVLLVSAGGGRPETPPGIDHVHLGMIRDDRLMAAAYSAADLFVIPSLEEAFGQTALEAIACGTPVAGFAAGGIPDVVRPGETGVLAPVGDASALAAGIVELLREPDRRARMSARCREVATSGFGLLRQAGDYRILYDRMRQENAAGEERVP